MYNRYVPQSDGSYRRSSMPEPLQPKQAPQPQERPPAPPSPVPECAPEPSRQPQQRRCKSCQNQKAQAKRPETSPTGIGSFLKQLLPKDFDTGDLLVVILLLLMSADNCDDHSTALLTLALYLFL